MLALSWWWLPKGGALFQHLQIICGVFEPFEDCPCSQIVENGINFPPILLSKGQQSCSFLKIQKIIFNQPQQRFCLFVYEPQRVLWCTAMQKLFTGAGSAVNP